MESYEINKEFEAIKHRFELLNKQVDEEQLRRNIEELKTKQNEPNFWDDNREAARITKQLTQLEATLTNYHDMRDEIDNFHIALTYFNENELTLTGLNSEFNDLETKFKSWEMNQLLNQPYDAHNAYLEVHPGAGGTESQDWAQMIFEMYQKYCKKHNYQFNIVDYQPADVGLKSVLVEIKGNNSYGLFKGENGIHRLVRISPFDANKKRHTSFCSVKVMPVIEDNDDIIINESEIKIDRYRSSGAGGQSVNTTDSAIRITHLPTGIVVTCQNERSQIQNKQQALKILQAKLLEMKLQAQAQEKEKLNGNTKEIGWGSQKRSYVLHPYKMVKDNVSGYETSQAEKVLNGDIEELLYYNLVNGEE